MRFCDRFVNSLVVLCQIVSALTPIDSPEDATLYFEELAAKYGHPARRFDVITEDGYILSLYNLPGTKRGTVFLMHGMSGTSDIWMLRGNISLPIVLADAGYDVWLGNNRGNRYSRRHLHLDPDRDPAFWDFTLHEFGVYDLSAMIDKVLEHSGVENINTICHSLGCTIFYVLASTRPEYNVKIKVINSLAPVAYFVNIPPLISTIFRIAPLLDKVFSYLNIHELFNKPTRIVVQKFCPLPVIGYKICIEYGMFTLVGSDPAELSPRFAPIIYPHFPSSSSVKVFLHLAQFHNRKLFAEYDYGLLGNRKAYNASVPPEYDLSKVSAPVALLVGRNDKLSVVKDVRILRRKLPNVVSYVVSARAQFNHIDVVWGMHMDKYLYPYIFKILDLYS